MTLFWQQFKAMRLGLLVWSVVDCLLAIAIAKATPSFTVGGGVEALLKALPEGWRSMIGVTEGISPVDAFVATQVTKSLCLVVVLYGILIALNAVTREVDRRTIDFLLALPVQRTELLASRVAVMAVNTGITALIIWGSLCAGLSAMGLQGSWGLIGLIFLNVWLLAMAVGGITLLASLWIDDYSLGVKLFLGVGVGAYILELVLRAAGVSRWIRAISPFSYVDPMQVLHQDSSTWVNMALLALIAIVTIGLSFPVFRRKQITA